MKPLRILFAGSPEIAVPALGALAAPALSGGPWVLAGVVTNPDKPRGRRGLPEPTAVAAAAQTLVTGNKSPLPVLKFDTLRTEAREAAAALTPDLLVSFAYGRIFGPKFLSLFPLGGINIHPSLLPSYRGASPIQEALLRRDRVTGITIQRIAAEMDTGNIILQREIPLSGRETTESLSALAAKEGARLLTEALETAAGAAASSASAAAVLAVLAGKPQTGPASYCSLIERDSGIIDWTRSAPDIDAQIRAYTPWPLARTAHDGAVLYILEAAPLPEVPPGLLAEECGRVLGTDRKNGILIQTGGGILAVTRLQYQARKPLPWQAFLNGARDFIGSRLRGS